MMIAEYHNLVIINIYLQAGSRSSPGQEPYWLHYSRCRYDLLNIIYDMCENKYSDKSVVICGDFNMDLDANVDEFPEIEMINKFKKDLKFIDTYPHLNSDEGYTEDTDINLMRWNQKLIEKKYRFDAILFKNNDSSFKGVTKSEVIGLEKRYLDADKSDWFMKNMSEANGDYTKLRGIVTSYDGSKLIPINPSDHFGVLTTFH
jgi:hypothetical protein